MGIEEKTEIVKQNEHLKTIENVFLKRIKNVNTCLYRFFEENETYDWNNIKKELSVLYNGLPELLKKKHQQEYDQITKTIGNFSNSIFQEKLY